MRPRMMGWERAVHEACCGRIPGYARADHHHYSDPGWEGGGFGVRRPLRFLTWKLQLDESQVARLAAILDELKTERAQAAVDERRTLGALAEVMAGESFDAARAAEAAAIRTRGAERVQEQLVRALGRIHELLTAEQRARFAYLVRSGSLGL